MKCRPCDPGRRPVVAMPDVSVSGMFSKTQVESSKFAENPRQQRRRRNRTERETVTNQKSRGSSATSKRPLEEFDSYAAHHPPRPVAPPTRWRSTSWPARWTMASGSAQRSRRVAPPLTKADCSTTMTSLHAWIGDIAADAGPLDHGRGRRSRTDAHQRCAHRAGSRL